MNFDRIEKDLQQLRVAPNLVDYEETCATFSWDRARAQLDGTPGGGLNVAYEALDRHLVRGRGDKVALRWRGRNGESQEFTYRSLSQQSNRFAHVLARLGIGRGDRVFGLSGRIPEFYIAVMGTLKNASVFSPLFSAFGPDPIQDRMTIGSAAVLVTTEKLYRKKVAPWREQLPTLKHVLLIGEVSDPPQGTHVLADLMAEAPDELPASVETAPEDWSLLHFTSGTTGHPKGAIHVHDAVVCHHITGQYALDLHPDDIYWCTADPGWVTGTSYGIIAPLTNGVTMVVDEGEFDAERWYHILAEERVSVWYTAPTAIRMLMKFGIESVRQHDLSALRFMASVGEPLNPEAVLWGQKGFGMPFHDNWWQTETGGIMVANYPAMAIKPGSMGRPLPGIEAAVMTRDGLGNVHPLPPNTTGELALKAGWPSMFRGYLNREDRYRGAFADGWYFTEDLAQQDEDGYIWFVGRADDVIKTAGHLVGPFEVESVLMENEAVAEAGVIGIPDEVSGQAIKAFVALKPGYEPSDDLWKALMGHARKRLGAAISPKSLEFKPSLPKTRSGKIMRRLLKAREQGLPEGDISTLETDSR